MKTIKSIKSLKLNTFSPSEAIHRAKRFTERSDSSFRGGFSLMEMLIAVAIFTTTVVGIIGVMLTVLNVQRRTTDVQAVLDNVRFSLELMTKELRTGTSYQLTDAYGCDVLPGNNALEFISASDITAPKRVYFLGSGANAGVIMRARLASTDNLISPGDCDGIVDANTIEAIALTSEDVNVTRLRFMLRGQNYPDPTDGQPFITISLGVQSRNPKLIPQTSMNIQTSVVQRIRDQ